MMDNRRQDLLNRLEAAATKTVRTHEDFVSLNEEFISLTFQILYGLPEALQFRAAFHMCERYLPIFEKKQPGATWVRQLLGDMDAWFRAARRSGRLWERCPLGKVPTTFETTASFPAS